jgi:hypothetical protein
MSIPSDRVLGTPPTNTPVTDPSWPIPGSDFLYLPTDVTPEQIFQAIGRLRKEARDEIDRLIRFLDKTDDYVSRELEDSIDDNPHDDNELDGPEHAEDEQSEPDEPSLGAFEGHDDQSVSWKCSNRSDRELDGAESGIGDQDGMQEQLSGRVYPSGLKIDGVL